LDEVSASLHHDHALEADLAEGAVEFSIGNPRVEHITVLVHLYRDFPVPAPQQVSRAGGALNAQGGWGSTSDSIHPPISSLPVGVVVLL